MAEWVAGNTAGPNGTVMTADERLRAELTRHRSDSPNARANNERDDDIRAAARRVAEGLAAKGQRDPGREKTIAASPQLGMALTRRFPRCL